MLFINTRPVDRAAALTFALQAADIAVLELPLLELQALALDSTLLSQFQQLHTVKTIVVVSPMAVAVGMQYLQQCQIKLTDLAHIHWIAVGEATADCLQQYGIQSYVPKVETSEGMLQLPVLNQLETQSSIAFWRGEGGRQFMMEQLQKAGHQIVNMLLYQRACPAHAQQIFLQAQPLMFSASVVIVLISSEASWLNWTALCQSNSALLVKFDYWVLGERLAEVLNDYAQAHEIVLKVHQIDQLKTEYLRDALQALKGAV